MFCEHSLWVAVSSDWVHGSAEHENGCTFIYFSLDYGLINQ
jgi:hypothetical protein